MWCVVVLMCDVCCVMYCDACYGCDACDSPAAFYNLLQPLLQHKLTRLILFLNG